jgi:hypothetical protein
MSQGIKVQVGDFCVKGHKIEGDNLYIQRRGNVYTNRCVICTKAESKERNQRYRKSEHGKDVIAAQLRRKNEKSRAERYDKILASEIAGGVAKYTGLNYLKLGKRAQMAWEPLEKRFDDTKSNCYENPLPYIDYHEDTPPDKQMAYKLCEGCEMLVECARFAAAYKPVVGVWGGEVWENGSPIKSSYR